MDNSCHGLGTGDKNGLFFRDVSMCKFDSGFGSELYTRNSRFWNCHAARNNNGVQDLVDGHVYGCEINANDNHGVYQSTGANDTTFVGNKVEWNSQNNYHFFDVSSNNVSGGVVDRSGDHGVVIKAVQ